MNNVISLDKNYSTTRRVIKADPQEIAGLVKQSNKPEDKFETVLFLLEGENRQGEGGLRTQGYFKTGGIIPSPLNKEAPSPLTESTSPEAKPLITVVTVVFNGEQFLEETILSVINQTYDNVEYIIIDGGSTDGTLDIIRKYEHAIDYWVSEKDKGIYDAMNKGISYSVGEWLCYMNAGDKFTCLNVLAKVADLMVTKKRVDVFYSDTNFMYETGVEIFVCNHKPLKVIHQSVIYRKKLHSRVGSNYLVFSSFSTSDYLFFKLISDMEWFKCDFVISDYSPYGVSSGLRTYRNKVLIDMLIENTSVYKSFGILVLHPFYHFLKKRIRKFLLFKQ